MSKWLPNDSQFISFFTSLSVIELAYSSLCYDIFDTIPAAKGIAHVLDL